VVWEASRLSESWVYDVVEAVVPLYWVVEARLSKPS
jgi:hypothetical protein